PFPRRSVVCGVHVGLASGLHCLVFVNDSSRPEFYTLSLHDALPISYDKVARLLGLPYPGGQPIDTLAQSGDPTAIRFPRALPGKDVHDFSFSGLKTSVSVHLQRHGVPEGQALADLCASFQEAVADSLTRKTVSAARALGRRDVVLCGGVAANSRIRSLLQERGTSAGLNVHLPAKRLCTDNGAMIAVAGYEAHRRGLVGEFNQAADPAWRL